MPVLVDVHGDGFMLTDTSVDAGGGGRDLLIGGDTNSAGATSTRIKIYIAPSDPRAFPSSTDDDDFVFQTSEPTTAEAKPLCYLQYNLDRCFVRDSGSTSTAPADDSVHLIGTSDALAPTDFFLI